MKNKINIFLLISFLIALIFSCYIYFLSINSVGQIKFNEDTDNVEFTICDKNIITQYYSVNTSYNGGRNAIRTHLEIYLNDGLPNFGKKSGWITYRFIVNCNGETGRFRVKEVDADFKETSFDSSEKEKLLKSIKSLKNWASGRYKDKVYDSYYQITFKIQNGKIKEIF